MALRITKLSVPTTAMVGGDVCLECSYEAELNEDVQLIEWLKDGVTIYQVIPGYSGDPLRLKYNQVAVNVNVSVSFHIKLIFSLENVSIKYRHQTLPLRDSALNILAENQPATINAK